jgi:hypothetical protein
MADELSLQDGERAEKIYKTVEAQLKFRYSWIGLFTAALIGGGAYTVISGLTSSVKEELNKATFVIDQAKEQLAELRKQSSSMSDDLEAKQVEVDKLKQSLADFDEQRKATDEQFAVMRKNIADNIDLLEEASATVKKVISEIEQTTGTKLAGATASLVQLTKNVGQATAKLQNGEYRIFLHTGGARALGEEFVEQVVAALRYQGFTVAGRDDQWDQVGGPGVDYFVKQDAAAAQAIADAVNDTLPPGAAPVRPRQQSTVRNPPGTIGLWL